MILVCPTCGSQMMKTFLETPSPVRIGCSGETKHFFVLSTPDDIIQFIQPPKGDWYSRNEIFESLIGLHYEPAIATELAGWIAGNLHLAYGKGLRSSAHDQNGHLIGYDPKCTECQRQPVKLKVSFDIGGVLSKYPNVFRQIVEALQLGGIEVFVITDIHDHAQSVKLVQENGFNIPADHILNSDYTAYGENCKAFTIAQHKIDLHVDDFPGYCAHTQCVSLFVWPNPKEPYFADDFKADASESNWGRRIKVTP